MADKIRVGIIGTGFGGNVQAPIMRRHPGYEVVAIASVARGHPDEIKTRTGVERVYTDWQDMLDREQLDLVSITSAPFLHHDMALEAYRHGCHVLCEKPMAMDSAQSQAMIQARDRAGRLGFIDFEFRFLPARLKAKELIASDVLGRVLHVSYAGVRSGSVFAPRRLGWLDQKEKGGGILGALGSHMFDSLTWWLDSPVETVSGQLATFIPTATADDGQPARRTADDAFWTIGTLRGGATFAAGVTAPTRQGAGWRLEVYGTDGTLVMTDDREVLLGTSTAPLSPVDLPPVPAAPPDLPEPASRYYTPMVGLLDRIYDAIVHGQVGPLLPVFEDGHRVQAVLDAVRRSDAEGKRIPVATS